MRALLLGRLPITQLLRFTCAGGGIAVATVLVYAIAAGPLALAPMIANLLSYLFNVGVGFRVHAAWSFGDAAHARGAGARYLAVSLGAFALNSVWVWLMTGIGHAPAWTPIVPMVAVTPLFTFCAARLWVFAARSRPR